VALSMDGEVRSLVEDQARCGLVGPAGDSQALADNIRTLHAMTREQRMALGARGKAYHFAHLERSIVLSRLMDFILK